MEWNPSPSKEDFFQSTVPVAMNHDFNGASFSGVGSLEGLQRLLQFEAVSDEAARIHFTTGYHGQCSRIAEIL